MVSECERAWLLLRIPWGVDVCPSEKLDLRKRLIPLLPLLAPWSSKEEMDSSFWELLDENRLELLLLLLLVALVLVLLWLPQARPCRPRFPIARYSGPSLASLWASSWLPAQGSSLWLVMVLVLISLTEEESSLGEVTLSRGRPGGP